MPNLKDIRKRIGTVKNTQKITRAMKMVAAAKLRRAQEAVVKMRPYAQTLARVTRLLTEGIERDVHPLLRSSETPKRAHLLVITSDRGLCGAYNTNINRMALRFINERRDRYESLTVDVIGRKAREFLAARKVSTRRALHDAWTKPTSEVVDEIVSEAIQRFVQGDVDEVYVMFTRFKSALVQEAETLRLLPFDNGEDASKDASKDAPKDSVPTDYLYEPSKDLMLGTLLPRFISTQVRQALLESFASEQGSRMSSMDNATKNAGEMVSNLTLIYNRARQAFITRELIEIISGAEAL
jgi:F-type H+-transporting ATPase subunit gamma